MKQQIVVFLFFFGLAIVSILGETTRQRETEGHRDRESTTSRLPLTTQRRRAAAVSLMRRMTTCVEMEPKVMDMRTGPSITVDQTMVQNTTELISNITVPCMEKPQEPNVTGRMSVSRETVTVTGFSDQQDQWRSC